MSGEWVEQNVDVVDVEITSFLRGIRRRGYSFEKETDESGIVGYIVSHQGTEIGEIEIAPNQLRGSGIRYTERIAIGDPYPHAFRNLLERLESRLDVRLVWAPRAAAEIHTEPQADSGAVAEQLTPAEDRGARSTSQWTPNWMYSWQAKQPY